MHKSIHDLAMLDCGSLWWSSNGTDPSTSHPVFAYVINTYSGNTVLVDTGNPRSLVGRATAEPWFDSRVSMSPEHDLLSQLARLHIEIDDVDILVSTHLHFDHCGNHDLFDGSGVVNVIHSDQFNLAECEDDPDYRRLWDRPGIGWELIDGDFEIEPGLELLHTPGHCVGHLSVCVETEAGPVILAIDAIDDHLALGEGPFPSFYFTDHDTWRASQQRLLDLQASTGATIFCGHQRDSIPVQM